MKRTHTCGELRITDEGREITLNGWVDSVRDHGGVLFVDLRDRYGKTQIVFKTNPPKLKPESVIAIKGTVVKRTPQTINPRLATGEIEIVTNEFQIINESKPLPFPISEEVKLDMETRLKHRYLDLRTPKMQNNIITRHRITKTIRDYFNSNGFLEIETPYLVKYTPGGARNFLVPSRLFPGSFFALAESPQIFKQLYMLCGFDRYYQIAKCFRDEDPRLDRVIEFSQLDLEMSFVEQDDVMTVIEGCICALFQEILNIKLERPFRRVPFDETMAHYGIDKPDLRFGMQIADITDLLKGSTSNIIRETLNSKGVVRSFACPKVLSRKQIDDLTQLCTQKGGKGLISIKPGTQSKLFSEKEQDEILKRTGAVQESTVLIVADKKASEILGALRLQLADQFDLRDKSKFIPCWVINFPMFERLESGEIGARHHPFTSPCDEDLSLLESKPFDVKAKAYDLVINGVEIGGGSIRIHRSDVQARIFKALGLSEREIEEKFSFLIEAFQYGAPPHGGIALGLDRLATMLLGHESIREVIALPKTQTGQDIMTGAPTPVSENQLKELHIKILDEQK